MWIPGRFAYYSSCGGITARTSNWSVVSVVGSDIVACRTGNDGAVIGSSLGLNSCHCRMCILSKIIVVIKGQSARGFTTGCWQTAVHSSGRQYDGRV